MPTAKILPFGEKAFIFATRDPRLDKFITILEGAIRTGKTFSFHPKILFQLCKYQVDGLRVICGVSKNTIMDNLLRDLFDIAGQGNYHYNVTTGDLRLFGVDWIVIGAKDEGSEKYLRGKTVGIAIVEEGVLIPKSFFMQLMGRLSPKGSRMYVSTNPDSPYHFLRTDIIDNPDMAGDVKVIHFDLDDNPSLPVETRKRYERSYTGVFYERMILGRWVIAQGAIYRDALGPQCRYTNAERPEALLTSFAARYILVDYGTVNPCVFLDVYDDGKMLFQDREYYHDSRAAGKAAQIQQIAQKTDQEYADDFEIFVGKDRRGLIVVCDPSAASFKAELNKRGFQVKNGDNEVLEGIRRTASALKTGVYKINADNCPKTLEELQTYSWSEKRADKGIEEPLKEHDHAPDAVRMGVMTCIPKWRLR